MHSPFSILHSPFSILLLFWLVLLPVLAAPAAAQAPTVQLEAVPAFEGNYLPGSWLPLDITVRNDGPALAAQVQAVVPNSPGVYMLPVDLPGGETRTVTLYVPMGENSSIQVRVMQADTGPPLAETAVEVRPREGERLLGIATAQSLPALGLRVPPRQEQQRGDLPFVTFPLPLTALPDNALGLRSLTLLLVTDVPDAALSAAQERALLAWVAGGGHLVLGGGANARGIASSVPAALRPAETGATVDLAGAALGEFVAGSPFAAGADAADGPADLTGVQLQPVAGATAYGPADAPLWVQQQVGEGQVTQLAFDPGATAIQEWQAAPALWDRLLVPALVVENTPFGMQTSRAALQEQILSGALLNLPAINLPPANILFGVLLLYVVIVGPGVALLLRRRGQQAWGWVVLPVVVLGFSGLAFGLAIGLRADERIISKLSLVEQVPGDQAYARNLAAFLAPRDRQDTVQVPPLALVRPARSASGVYGDLQGAEGVYRQQSGSVMLELDSWQAQGIVAEDYIALPALAAQIVLDEGTIRAEVTNSTDYTLRDVVVAYQRQVARIGDLAPGGQGSAPWPVAPGTPDEAFPRGTALAAIVLGEELAAGRGPGRLPNRAVLAQEQLIQAAIGRGPLPEDEQPLVLAWLDRSPLPLTPDETGAATRQTTLLTAPVDIVGSGAVQLPAGWLGAEASTDELANCFVGPARGFLLSAPPVTLTLQLPRDLAALEPTALSLRMESSDQWPETGVTTRLYSWRDDAWVDTDFDGPGELQVADPAQYMQDGRVRLSLDGRINEAQCLLLSAQVNGDLP